VGSPERRPGSLARGKLRDTSFDPVRDKANKDIAKATQGSLAIAARQRQAEQQADIQSGRKVA